MHKSIAYAILTEVGNRLKTIINAPAGHDSLPPPIGFLPSVSDRFIISLIKKSIMKINNQVDTTSTASSKFLDSREIKKSPDGIKVRLYGDAVMGYSYFQEADGGKVKVVRSLDVPEMVNPTDGYQGAEQKPAKNLYIVAWNYATEAPCILTLDKVALINGVIAVNDDKDLGDATDYDFKMSYDANAAPQDKYRVVRLDKKALTATQKKELQAFADTVDLEALAAGADVPF